MGQVSGTIQIAINLQDYVSTGYVNPVTFPAQLASPGFPGASLNFTAGTGALQLDCLYWKPIALLANTPQTLDLTSLTGLGGEPLNYARVRALVLFNNDGTAGHDVKLYQGASDGLVLLPPPALPPGLVTATPSTTGGTFAAGTYYYKVTATTASGETIGSAEVSATTTGTTGSVALAWAAVPGASGYKVYRATSAGGEGTSPALVTTIGSGSTTTYTDTGAATTAGSVPATSTAASATPLWARANNGLVLVGDPNSTGAGNGQVVTATSKTVTLDSGANAVTPYLMLAGGSAA